MKRLERAISLCRRLKAVFACPVCGCSMDIGGDQGRSLVCANRHCFDLSAKGYVNLLLSSQRKSLTPGYTREMLEARRAVLGLGFFDPLCQAVADPIKREWLNRGSATGPRLLDAGCGEGYVLSAILSRLPAREGFGAQALGLDISKQGIEIACRHDHSIMWCVANIARRLPFMTEAFDVVTNVLAPSNTAEFRRVLRDGGLLIRVIPMQGHLAELRGALYERPREHSCAAEEETTELAAHFEVVESRRLTYSKQPGVDSIRDIIRMTPLFWKAKQARIAALERTGLPTVTVDVSVIVALAR